MKRTRTCTPNTLYVYEVHINEILVTENPQLVMLLTMHLQNEIEPDLVPVTFISILNDPVQLAKHAPVGSLQLYTECHDNQNINNLEINQVINEKEG